MINHQKTWDNYHKLAEFRGEFVAETIVQFTKIKNKDVLDIGCGDGGTSLKLTQLGAQVTAIDIRPDIFDKFKNTGVKFIHGSVEHFSFKKEKFDIIILQDVLEHIPHPETTIQKCKSILSETGIIYISTPNRLSLLNVFGDPHWSLPFVSLLSRKWVRLFVKDIFRKDRRQREDWAALLSLFKLRKLLNRNQFEMIFVNSLAVKYLFEKPESIVCKSSHIKLINWMQQTGFDQWIKKIVNDKFGIFNYFVNPTWYVVVLHKGQKNTEFKIRTF
ncbi:methyltransferase domain-containing protein [candidate division KSB1 bacterium]|nr:methyltransferase domain-containing protein [candidate division KSB1 bacterium]